MVWLGVGTALVVLGRFVYYTRPRTAKAEGAALGVGQPVSRPTEQREVTSTALTTQSSTAEIATSNEMVLQRPTSTPSLSLTSSGDSPEAQQTQRV
jgi:hypothetical protein